MPTEKSAISDFNLAPKQGEHIFNATRLTALAIEWQKLNTAGEHEKALALLEEIVKGSTAMFERFAQYEGYDNSVDLETLVLAAQEKIVRWLLAWRPEDGKLFSFFSKCAKNVFKSEVARQSSYRTRIHATGENLEKYHGAEDHPTYHDEAASNMKKRLQSISVRWGAEQEKGAIRYLIDAISAEEHDRTQATRGAAFAFGLSHENARFFYNWALFGMRNELFQMAHVPFTEQDLFRLEHSYTQLVDLLEIVSWDQLKRIIMTMGGTKLKIPTAAQLAKLKERYEIARAVEATDKDPEAVATVGRKFGKSYKSAQQIFEEITELTDSRRDGDHDLYGES